MSYCTTMSIEVENVDKSIVKEIMDELGWDGDITDVIGGTVYFEGSGNICIGTSEIKQEECIRKAFNEKMSDEIDISIFWD